MTLLLYSLTYIFIISVIFIVFFTVCIAIPLRGRLYEDIFYYIGANINSVELHKAETSFFATNKVDLITHLLYLNTLAFLCYFFSL